MMFFYEQRHEIIQTNAILQAFLIKAVLMRTFQREIIHKKEIKCRRKC